MGFKKANQLVLFSVYWVDIALKKYSLKLQLNIKQIKH